MMTLLEQFEELQNHEPRLGTEEHINWMAEIEAVVSKLSDDEWAFIVHRAQPGDTIH